MAMTYNETIAYLYAQLPMFSRIGAAAYKADLHNTIALCKALNNPEQKFKTIHIAGTNGKGSTSHMLAAILQEAGYKTGLYTSPHIKDFGERIRINGEMIDEAYVVDFVERTKQITATIQPSFFELTVAMAFEYFANEQVDIAIIETGMGGMLDSTNVITPLVSIITNIGYDHTNLLGNTLAEIAYQKAGIIKPSVPVIIGEKHPETKAVFINKAAGENAPIVFAEDRFEVLSAQQLNGQMVCDVRDKHNNLMTPFSLDLNGWYQSKNIISVLCAVDILRNQGFSMPAAVVTSSLQKVKKLTGLRGRWDILQQQPTIITDVAHNAAGIEQILLQLNNDYQNAALHFVMGFVKDKDIQNVLELLPANASYYFTNAHLPRALSYQDLQSMAAEAGLSGKGFDDVNDAIAAAKKAAANNDVIVVCGSFFIIAEIASFSNNQ